MVQSNRDLYSRLIWMLNCAVMNIYVVIICWIIGSYYKRKLCMIGVTRFCEFACLKLWSVRAEFRVGGVILNWSFEDVYYY